MVVEFTDMALGKTVVDPTSGRGMPFTNDGYYSILLKFAAFVVGKNVSAAIDACYTSNRSSFQFLGFMRVL